MPYSLFDLSRNRRTRFGKKQLAFAIGTYTYKLWSWMRRYLVRSDVNEKEVAVNENEDSCDSEHEKVVVSDDDYECLKLRLGVFGVPFGHSLVKFAPIYCFFPLITQLYRALLYKTGLFSEETWMKTKEWRELGMDNDYEDAKWNGGEFYYEDGNGFKNHTKRIGQSYLKKGV